MVEKSPESADTKREPPASAFDRGNLHGGDSGWGLFSQSYNRRLARTIVTPPSKDTESN